MFFRKKQKVTTPVEKPASVQQVDFELNGGEVELDEISLGRLSPAERENFLKMVARFKGKDTESTNWDQITCLRHL